ncbi:50S ribosomal protein L17 [Gemmatimonadota bacterium]
MRHMKKGRQLNRTASHRRALLGNLITSLFLHERIRTTTAKAKEARPLAEKLITYAKRGDLHARRQVLRIIKDKEAVTKLFETLGVRFKERPGGYTRILKLGNRNGDNAEMALLELVAEEISGKGGGRKRRRRSKKQEAAAAAPAVQQEQQPEEQVVAEVETAPEQESVPEAEAAPVEEIAQEVEAAATEIETESPPAEEQAEEPAAESSEQNEGEEKKEEN